MSNTIDLSQTKPSPEREIWVAAWMQNDYLDAGSRATQGEGIAHTLESTLLNPIKEVGNG